MQNRELFFNTISDDYEKWLNPFDRDSRLQWFEKNLACENLDGKSVLDAGAGIGHCSDLAKRLGASVTPLDIAENFYSLLRKRHPQAVCASTTALPFEMNTFDFVISSECIEHTSDPRLAIVEMLRVLKPGGKLLLTTPNAFWRWSIWIAKFFNLRKFDGIENWLWRSSLENCLLQNHAVILSTTGLNILPFQFSALHGFIRFMNKHGQWAKALMINQCWVSEKLPLR